MESEHSRVRWLPCWLAGSSASKPSGQSLNNSFFHDRVVLEGCWHEKRTAGGTKVTLLALLMSVISVQSQWGFARNILTVIFHTNQVWKRDGGRFSVCLLSFFVCVSMCQFCTSSRVTFAIKSFSDHQNDLHNRTLWTLQLIYPWAHMGYLCIIIWILDQKSLLLPLSAASV